MNLLIFLSWSLSFAGQISPPQPSAETLSFQINSLRREGAIAEFDLDFGAFEIRSVKARIEGDPSSVRFPASVLRSGRSKPEIDFLSRELEKKIYEALLSPIRTRTPAAAGVTEKIHIASLERIESKKGSRLAEAEIWIAEALTVKVSLIRSKWSSGVENAWIAYPSVWREKEKRYEDLFRIKDKMLKQRIRKMLIQAYMERH